MRRGDPPDDSCAQCAAAPATHAPPLADPSPVAGRYRILTWGCQMNVHDSEKLAGSLEREGYRPAAGIEDADVILLNTCSIREKAAEKLFSELGRLKQLKQERPNLVLGVCGCVAQQEGSRIFERAPHVDLVVGPRATGSLPLALARRRESGAAAGRHVDTEYRDDSIRFPFEAIRREAAGAGKSFVTLIEGCNHRCTYCIVPTTRGREICRSFGSVVDELSRIIEQGGLEVELLGQTVNAYRDADGRTLADLLLAARRLPGLRRLRFTTSHPAQMTERLLDAMAEASPPVCPYLHLPVQSGSSAVLAAMRRGYDRKRYVATIGALRRRLPEIALGTDLIVGFPTEGDADFAETLSLLDEIEFDTVYSFTYSPRPGTASVALGDRVPASVKQERLARLQEHQLRIQERRMRSWVGREVEVLVTGRSKRDFERFTGRTPENRVVNFSGRAEPGQLARVRIASATALALAGEVAAPA